MITVNKKTGLITTDDGWQLEFRGNRINVSKGNINHGVSFEMLVGGTTIVLYNDLSLRGVESKEAESIINLTKAALEKMDFNVEVQ